MLEEKEFCVVQMQGEGKFSLLFQPHYIGAELIVLDMNGNLLLGVRIEQTKQMISLEHLNSGIYLLEINGQSMLIWR